MPNKVIPFPEALRGDRDELTVCVPLARLGLHAISGLVAGRQFLFDGVALTIGRAATCNVVIPSKGVSRNHARIEFRNGAYWLFPEQTANGTWVNGMLVHEPRPLHDQDQIAIYDTTFVVACRAVDPAADDFGPPIQPPPPPAPDGWPQRPSAQTWPNPIGARPSRPSGRMSRPIATAQPPRRRWGMWLLLGFLVVALVVGVAVATVSVIAPPAPVVPATADVAPLQAPAIAPAPATVPEPKPEPEPEPEPVAAPEPAPRGMLSIETTPVKAGGRGTVVEVVEVGSTIERGAPIARYREHSAAVRRARAKLAKLEREFEGSPDHEDFIAQARQNVRVAQNRRAVRPIVAPLRGTIARVAVKPGDELRAKKLVVELAVARITVPDDAVEGDGKRCTAELAGTPVEGELLEIGLTERTLELDRVPPDIEPGDVGEVRIRCAAR